MEIKIKKSGTRSRRVFIRTDGWEPLTYGKIHAVMKQIWWLHWLFLEIRDYAMLDDENVKFIARNKTDIIPDYRYRTEKRT